MRYCEACHVAEGSLHVSVTVDVFGTVSSRRKVVQFWLCPDCERESAKVLARDVLQRGRVAHRLTYREPVVLRNEEGGDAVPGAAVEAARVQRAGAGVLPVG